VIIPDDDPILESKIQKFPLKFIRVGASAAAAYRLSDIKTQDGWVSFNLNGISFSFPGVAAFLSRNAAMAVAMADQYGIKLQDLPRKWNDLKLPSGRYEQQIILDGVHAIFDGYNASPASFEAAVQTFEEMRVNGRKTLVFSDMLELGAEEKRYHEELGTRIAKAGFDYVVAYGKRSLWTLEKMKTVNSKIQSDYVENAQEAAQKLQGKLRSGDWILLKASRSMRIENVLTHLSGNQPIVH
jgi:UDP-N-acetylmuramoyl-tripeptide--D-alanyl-D-alanine ligase